MFNVRYELFTFQCCRLYYLKKRSYFQYCISLVTYMVKCLSVCISSNVHNAQDAGREGIQRRGENPAR